MTDGDGSATGGEGDSSESDVLELAVPGEILRPTVTGGTNATLMTEGPSAFPKKGPCSRFLKKAFSQK